jgi:hypothetical protein
MRSAQHLLTAAIAAGCMAGCDKAPTLPTGAAVPPAPEASRPVAAAPTDRWLGQWHGPEGTFLRIEGSSGRYQLTIQNLDGPRRFEGRADGERIAFERDGQRESLHASNGDATGMKWLAGKANCLTVKTGEGYCRD